MDWFLYNRGLRHERFNAFQTDAPILFPLKTSKNRVFFVFSREKTDRWFKMGKRPWKRA